MKYSTNEIRNANLVLQKGDNVICLIDAEIERLGRIRDDIESCLSSIDGIIPEANDDAGIFATSRSEAREAQRNLKKLAQSI